MQSKICRGINKRTNSWLCEQLMDRCSLLHWFRLDSVWDLKHHSISFCMKHTFSHQFSYLLVLQTTKGVAYETSYIAICLSCWYLCILKIWSKLIFHFDYYQLSCNLIPVKTLPVFHLLTAVVHTTLSRCEYLVAILSQGERVLVTRYQVEAIDLHFIAVALYHLPKLMSWQMRHSQL